MKVNAVPGSGAHSPLSPTPAAPTPQGSKTSAAEPSAFPKRGTDRVSLSEASKTPSPSRPELSETVQRAKAAQGKAFDVTEASERLIQSHGGNLEQAYFESLELRNTTKEKGYPEKLAAYSEKLGMTRNLSPDELRDIEHYMFAAASTAEKAAPGKDATQLDRSLAVLGREPHAVALAVLTAGYSAAKVVNQSLPDSLKFLKSRTAPSLDEVSAGMKGIWRGLKDGI